jgi:hypothetical protein
VIVGLTGGLLELKYTIPMFGLVIVGVERMRVWFVGAVDVHCWFTVLVEIELMVKLGLKTIASTESPMLFIVVNVVPGSPETRTL